jgi:hypothetical protein
MNQGGRGGGAAPEAERRGAHPRGHGGAQDREGRRALGGGGPSSRRSSRLSTSWRTTRSPRARSCPKRRRTAS